MITDDTPAKVSAIVPVYNVAEHLPDCMDSLIAQTLDHVEILLIDDGSTDGSSALVDGYATAYPGRVRSYHKVNGGLGDARNFGIERATGDFFAFIDADDLAAPTMLERLYDCARDCDADLVVCGILNFRDEVSDGTYHPEPELSVFGHSLAEEPRLLYRLDASACNKLYARRLFMDTSIRFPTGVAFEDLPTTYRVLTEADRVEKIDEPLYLYRRSRSDSITAAYGANFLDLVEAFRSLDDYFHSSGLFDENKEALLRLHLTHLIAGRYPDLLLLGASDARRRFIEATFELLDAVYPMGWRHSAACHGLWPHPVLRSISTRRSALRLFCALPSGVYLRVLSRIGAFDPNR